MADIGQSSTEPPAACDFSVAVCVNGHCECAPKEVIHLLRYGTPFGGSDGCDWPQETVEGANNVRGGAGSGLVEGADGPVKPVGFQVAVESDALHS